VGLRDVKALVKRHVYGYIDLREGRAVSSRISFQMCRAIRAPEIYAGVFDVEDDVAKAL